MSTIRNSLKTTVLTFLIIGAFIGSWLFIQKRTKERQANVGAIQAGKPDGFTNKIVYRDIDEQGHLKNELASAQLTHFPKENSTQFNLPQFVVHTEGKSDLSLTSKTPWVITASRAETLPGNKIIKFYGNVSIDRAGDEKDSEKHFRTEALTFYLKENRLETQQAVILWQPGATIQAIGLKADLNKDIIHFLKKTRIFYTTYNAQGIKEEKFFQTNSLLFHPKQNLAETSDPVMLKQTGATLYATGLRANLKENSVIFLSNTKIIYTPNKNTRFNQLP